MLDILKRQGQATVDDLVVQLHARNGKRITAVTVRHHLSVLQTEGLVIEVELRRRATPGRPQNIYALTDKARGMFPNYYPQLVTALLDQISRAMPEDGVNVLLDGVAEQFAAPLLPQLDGLSLCDRLDIVVGLLNERGYEAHWQREDQGYVLHTRNCPYHAVSMTTDALCTMDMRFISALVGVVPRRLTRISGGAESCAYLIPDGVKTQ